MSFPMVPAAAALSPVTNQMILWSAYSPLMFGPGVAGLTVTATYNLATKEISAAINVGETAHDMFCPGISLDFEGRIIVTGGDTSPKTSIYNGKWNPGGDMNIPRGYQSTATTSDGTVFNIGGSWSANHSAIKDGELYDPKTNKWTLLTGCSVRPMLTNDANQLDAGDPGTRASFYRSDNHAWLFAWTNRSIFQAGPSSKMNWFGTAGNGSVTPAGTRADDPDSMCGNAVMYDAVAGKIFTAGGSPSYQDMPATSNVHIITIMNVNENPTPRKVQSMKCARVFANSVVLPDGKILVVGGQTFGRPFNDSNACTIPELWNPETESFTDMAEGPAPRNYHSVALLMPDGTVFSGGGGLNGECNCNHLDGQMYSPPYLFQADGTTAAPRPVIQDVTKEVKVGGTLEVTMKADGNFNFSMIRAGTSTHTVNTDQRRVPLTTNSTASPFSFTLPSDPGVLLPGYWLFFALQSGVPSIGEFVKVTL